MAFAHKDAEVFESFDIDKSPKNSVYQCQFVLWRPVELHFKCLRFCVERILLEATDDLALFRCHKKPRSSNRRICIVSGFSSWRMWVYPPFGLLHCGACLMLNFEPHGHVLFSWTFPLTRGNFASLDHFESLTSLGSNCSVCVSG